MVSNSIIKSAVNIMIAMHSFFVMAICMIGGVLEEEWAIDGHEMKDVCDVLRVMVVDDSRSAIAIGTLILMSPVVIYAAFNKFKMMSINVILLLFSLTWVWSFIIKYRNCLWF